MIFNIILRNKLITNWLTTFFVMEWYTITWVIEYDVEKYKAAQLAKRISAWFKPYNFFSRHFIGIVEKIQYTKISAVFFLISEFWFHFIRNVILFFFSFNFVISNWVKNPLFFKSIFFIKLTVVFVNNIIVWVWECSSRTRTILVNNLNLQKKSNILGRDKVWIHLNKEYNMSNFLNTLVVLDIKKISAYLLKIFLDNFLKNYIAVKMGNFLPFIFVVIVFTQMLVLFYNFFYFNFFKNIWLFIIVIFLLYFFISTFFNFSKTYSVNKYTSQTQRFWKRTFGIFWGLEFTLFGIYLYLTLISPAELASYSNNYKEIVTGLNVVKNTHYHLFYFFILLSVNFLYMYLLFLKKKNKFHVFKIILFVLNFFYCYILYYEFLKIYYSSGWGANITHTTVKSIIPAQEFNTLNQYNSDFYLTENSNNFYFKVPNNLYTLWSEISVEKQWVRTFRHFCYILIILKFWHIFFIFVYFSLSTVKFLETNYLSFDSISSNHQNAIYILWFYIFSYVLILKKKIYFLITFIYYWSSVQVSYVNLLNSFCLEMNLNYML